VVEIGFVVEVSLKEDPLRVWEMRGDEGMGIG
jgi:hypothetical protein